MLLCRVGRGRPATSPHDPFAALSSKPVLSPCQEVVIIYIQICGDLKCEGCTLQLCSVGTYIMG